MPVITDDQANSGFIFTFSLREFKKRKVAGISDIVYQTYWLLVGDMAVCPECGESHQAEFSGATPLKGLPVDENAVTIPYESLTEEIILGWVTTVLAGELHPFERIIKQIDDLHIESVTGGFPWEA